MPRPNLSLPPLSSMSWDLFVALALDYLRIHHLLDELQGAGQREVDYLQNEIKHDRDLRSSPATARP